MTVRDPSPEQYMTTLPRKRMGAGVLLLDPDGRVLLVEPTLMMIFDGGLVPPDVAAGITVPAEELSGWAFCTPQESADRLSPLLFRRVSACTAAQGAGTVAYLEDGRRVT